ncbi:TPA: hypothetical protein ACHVKA_003552 [Yersinia enterocolitica]
MSAEFKSEYLLMGSYPSNPIYDSSHVINFVSNAKNIAGSTTEQTELINQIAQATTKIIEAVNLSTNDGTLSAVFVAIVGALSAFLFNFLQQINDRRINRIKNTSKSIVDLITTLEDISLKYWITGYCNDKKDDISIDEARIKSLNLLIDKHIEKLLSYLTNRVKKKYNVQQLSAFPSAIFGLTTGGDFESPNRIQSKVTAAAISKKCLEATTVIKAISP